MKQRKLIKEYDLKFIPSIYFGMLKKRYIVLVLRRNKMRAIKLVLEPDGVLKLPFAYFEILQGLVYKLMSSKLELAEEIHNVEGSKKSNLSFSASQI